MRPDAVVGVVFLHLVYVQFHGVQEGGVVRGVVDRTCLGG